MKSESAERDLPMEGQMNLGRVSQVDLRDVWPGEATDFTPWLAEEEHLRLLGKAIGLSLKPIERERDIGSFSADIHAKETSQGYDVVIENQLEVSDHDHLGKLLTYAGHLEARAIIWIAKRFTDEHKDTLDWLNRISRRGTRFFGVEISLWQIGDSDIAPVFTVAVKPKDWAPKWQTEEELTEHRKLLLEFWTGFNEFVSRNGKGIQKCGAPRPRNWHRVSTVGISGIAIDAKAKWIESEKYEVSVYVYFRPKQAEIFDRIEDREEIEEALGVEPPTWKVPENAGYRSVEWSKTTDISDLDQRTDQHRWLLERAEALYRVFPERLAKLKAAIDA